MKKQFIILLVLVVSASTYQSNAQDAKQDGLDAITMQAIKGQLEFLSSDWTEGRATGQAGAYMAADYITSLFKVYGLKPAGDIEYTKVDRAGWMSGERPKAYKTFFQSFDLIEYKPGEEQEFALVNRSSEGSQTMIFGYKTDFSVRTADVAFEIESQVVFVGYGYKDEESGYNDFKGVDVKGKVILCLSGYPGHMDENSLAREKLGEKNSRTVRRAKNDIASELGVAAIIEVVPGRDVTGYWADNLPFRYNSKNYEGEVARASYYDTRMKHPGNLNGAPTALSISQRVRDELLEGSGIDLEKFEETVNANFKPASKELARKSVKIKTSVESNVIKARNVVGVVPGKDSSEIIVVGGHYDHLGIHDGWIWNGADDNASGTVGVMTIAKAMMAAGGNPEKTIVFAAWTGEEKGLLGSKYFADHPYNDAKVLLNLNYDMISRDDADDTLGIKLGYTYTKKYAILEDVAKGNNEEFELGLDINFKASEKPRGGSDYSSFSSKDIPVIACMAGFPPEYHQPNDYIELVNWDKMLKIIKLGYLNIWDLANTDWSE
jgi:Zn-dependent M28 family amino/carboxypeptidase